MTKIQKDIIERISTVAKTLTAGQETRTGIWTQEIKTALANLANERDLNAYAHSVNSETTTAWGEWLWDLVWAEHVAHPNLNPLKISGVRRLHLISEIEWNTNWDSIAIDFQKLVFGVADLKLYVFTKGSASVNQDIHEFCMDLAAVHDSTNTGDYLLIGVSHAGSDPELFVRYW